MLKVKNDIVKANDIEVLESIALLIDRKKHIEKIKPFIEDNKVEYFLSIQNYIEVYHIGKDKYSFNAVIQDHQFIKRNIGYTCLRELIESTFSIMKNYKKYKIIDLDFIKYGIDVFTCIDVSIMDIKDIIKVEDIKDITIEDDLITMYKGNNILTQINIKNEISFNSYTKEEQKTLLKYYYDKLEENNIKYSLIA